MHNINADELIRRFQQLAEIEPGPGATAQALARARGALVAAPPVVVASAATLITGKTVVGVSAALVALGGLLTWALPMLAPERPDPVEPRPILKAVGSVAYRQTTRVDGEPAVSMRLWIQGTGMWRAEKSDGSYVVVDRAKRRTLFVNPAAREATLQYDADAPQINLYDSIADLTADPLARKLPAKTHNGTEVHGFATKSQGYDFTIWANAENMLPILIEFAGKDNAGRSMTAVLDEFAFDTAFAPGLFSFEAPPSFKVEIKGAPQQGAGPDDGKVKDLVITPLVGVGPVKFGMTRDEVEKILGPPDAVQNAKDDITTLSYVSLGMEVMVGKELGVTMFSCSGANGNPGMEGFSGKTDKGIGIGASLADITRAYGEPTTVGRTGSSNTALYLNERLDFLLPSGEVSNIRIYTKKSNR